MVCVGRVARHSIDLWTCYPSYMQKKNAGLQKDVDLAGVISSPSYDKPSQEACLARYMYVINMYQGGQSYCWSKLETNLNMRRNCAARINKPNKPAWGRTTSRACVGLFNIIPLFAVVCNNTPLLWSTLVLLYSICSSLVVKYSLVVGCLEHCTGTRVTFITSGPCLTVGTCRQISHRLPNRPSP